MNVTTASFLRRSLFLLAIAWAVSLGAADSPRGDVIIWPAPPAEPLSPDYRVTVEGRPVPVYVARSVHGGDYAFVSFDFRGTVKVVVTGKTNLGAAVIRPQSASILARAEGDSLTFTLDRPRKLSLEPNGINGPLLLFANAPENNPPKEGQTNVVFFGPGIHKPERIILKPGQTLYLAGGAVVKGAVIAEKADGVRICGRGVLDGTDWPWLKGPAGHLVRIQDSHDVTIEDIVLRGSFAWTVVPMRCRHVVVRNLKIVGSRVENDDGINPCNSSDVLIEDCFVRTDDDCVALKGLASLNPLPTPVRGIQVQRCVFWCDRARIFLLGHESQAAAMEDLDYRDCDIIHYSMTPFLLEPGEQMPLRRARFENFRIDGDGQQQFVTLRPTVNQYMKLKQPGSISDVVFKDVILRGPVHGQAQVILQGAGETNRVERVTFENVVRYGETMNAGSSNLTIGGFTADIRFGLER